MKETRIIIRYFVNSLEQNLTNIPIFLMFLFAKLVRYGLFMSFLYFLVSGVGAVGGYTRSQMILFYIFFNLIDTAVQLLFREVYRFRPKIVSGSFDMDLVKPVNPLIRSLLGGPDFIDAGTLIILVILAGYFSTHVSLNPIYFFPTLFMLVNTFFLATAFHICVLSLGILTLTVDHLIMVYRDLTSLVRIPVDVFAQPLRALITFVIPVGIMFTFPAKTLLGLLSWRLLLISFAIGLTSLFLSLRFWRFALRHYSSASS